MENVTEKEATRFVAGYLEETRRIVAVMEGSLGAELPRLARVLDRARREGRTVFTMGNGGSASAASHLANDLNKYANVEGERRFKCVALTDNVPTILAIANDIGYEEVFVEQLTNLAEPGDVLIGISGSGNSPNCVKAIEYARKRGVTVATWTGYGGGKMATISDLPVVIPSGDMTQCENAHLFIHHCLVALARDMILRERGTR